MKFALILSLLLIGVAQAQVYETTVHTVNLSRTERTNVRVYRYLNSFGNKEVRLEATNIPRLRRVNPTLGYGRDTTDDGKIDTWFLIDADEGMVVKEEPSSDNWGINSLRTKVFLGYRSGARAHFAAAYGAVFGYLLMSVAHGYETEQEFWRELMDIEDMILRLQRARSRGQITDKQWNDSVEMIRFGLTDMQERFERAVGSEYLMLGGADVALWATGGVVLRFLGRGLGRLARPITESARVQEGRRAVGRIVQALKNRFTSKLRSLNIIPARVATAAIATRVSFNRAMRRTFRALMARNKLMYMTMHKLGRTSIAFRNAMLDWKYIALMGGLQLSTEAFANYSEVRSSNPTQFARNVMNHPDIVQNVGYMTSNAFMMTAASHGIRSRGLRFATCGFIALANSTVTNLVIKKETDYERIALDTGWEAIIGNAQIQLDLAALTYFEAKASRTNNPRLRLVGWAIVIVDQTAGFLGYSAATNYVESRGVPAQNSVQLVPVLVE